MNIAVELQKFNSTVVEELLKINHGRIIGY